MVWMLVSEPLYVVNSATGRARPACEQGLLRPDCCRRVLGLWTFQTDVEMYHNAQKPCELRHGACARRGGTRRSARCAAGALPPAVPGESAMPPGPIASVCKLNRPVTAMMALTAAAGRLLARPLSKAGAAAPRPGWAALSTSRAMAGGRKVQVGRPRLGAPARGTSRTPPHA